MKQRQDMTMASLGAYCEVRDRELCEDISVLWEDVSIGLKVGGAELVTKRRWMGEMLKCRASPPFLYTWSVRPMHKAGSLH